MLWTPIASRIDPTRRFDVLCLPYADSDFALAVRTALEGADASAADWRSAVEIALRLDYPHAALVPRHPLADLGGAEAWYAFRDGRLTHREPDAPRRVLVVEDDPDLAQLIAEALVDSDLAVRSAPDGVAALSLLPTWPPSLILLDLSMPLMSGEEFAEQYRALPGPHAPLVVVSGASDAAERAARIAARSVVAKPFDIDALRLLVERYA